ncbi:NUDIX domain-containing protein [Streptomyces sp. NPDC005492]|uniref:NUDIX domain-containing protein n=1 Tax=Streptomyces sp. NPDC005492 TaxID=3156883 RepID=UPI0033A60E6D
MTTPLVAAVIVHDRDAGRVLVLQRGEHAKFCPGMWDLPGGKHEPGEPITETAARELYEETGIVVAADSLKVVHLVHAASGVGAPIGYLTVVFVADKWSGDPENREPLKHAQVRWVQVDSVPEEFVRGNRQALRQYLGGVEPQVTPYGWE